MAKEFFKAHFYPGAVRPTGVRPEQRELLPRLAFLQCFSAAAAGEPARVRPSDISANSSARGYSILIYPEGRRTQQGEIGRFQPGAAMIAARLDVPVVPVRLEGLDRILHQSWKFPQRGRATRDIRRAYVIERKRLRRDGAPHRDGREGSGSISRAGPQPGLTPCHAV